MLLNWNLLICFSLFIDSCQNNAPMYLANCQVCKDTASVKMLLMAMTIVALLGWQNIVEAQPTGEYIYQQNACGVCHGRKGSRPIGNGIPKLASQNAAYLVNQLRAYRNLERDSAASQTMWTHARRLSDYDIRQIAEWLESQKP